MSIVKKIQLPVLLTLSYHVLVVLGGRREGWLRPSQPNKGVEKMLESSYAEEKSVNNMFSSDSSVISKKELVKRPATSLPDLILNYFKSDEVSVVEPRTGMLLLGAVSLMEAATLAMVAVTGLGGVFLAPAVIMGLVFMVYAM